ncbi:NUDIX domain-containing protein [uncultured Shimia sp.]|uniref:NUDIX domain-containing protein n=1 Tax=uncultured Shimia sp. TaxID=573152 RepID=UPI002615AB2D|nr:NUDIX domain-containing protein [uncultured Shimia sp.]
MKSLFFFGTLRYVPLLSLVLGRDAEALDVTQASLPGHQVHWAKDQAFPMIVKGAGVAQGLLVEGLSDEDVARLNYYEGGFDYTLRDVTLEAGSGTRTSQVYFPTEGVWVAGDPWVLEDWVQRWGEMTLYAAIEVMSYLGTLNADQVAAMFPMIRARATARVNARQSNPALSPSGFSDQDVTVTAVSRRYVNFFALDEYDLSFRRYDGGASNMVLRAVFQGSDAAIVLPYDPVRDRVLLIEQFRPGPFARGDEKPWQLEPIAGRVDAGETPKETAHRETREEAGLSLRELHDVSHCYASPGCTTEYYHIYLGICDLPDDVTGISGIESEAEDIRSYLFDFDELMDMVDKMQAVNAPLVLAALWLARHRERLRAGA